MRSAGSALKSLLAGTNPEIERLLTITPEVGDVIRLTSRDEDRSYGGNTYLADPGFAESALTIDNDGTVSTFDFVMPVADDLPVTHANLIAGKYDNARVQLVQIDSTSTAAGDMPIFDGKLGDFDASNYDVVTFEARSKLDQGRSIIVEHYGPTCRADLFDSRCGLDADANAWTVASVTVDGVSTLTLTVALGNGAADNRYRNGQLKWLTGNNAGFSQEVKSSTGATAVELWTQPKFAMQAGDTFKLYPGCSKVFEDATHGCLFFENTVNFRGEPFLAGRDFTLSIPPQFETVTTEETITEAPEPTKAKWMAV